MCAVFECLRLLCYGKSVTKLLPGQSGKNRSFEMADKISQDTLLNIAFQLFTTMPKNKIDRLNGAPLDEKYDKYADTFIKFYFRLRDKLIKDE